MQDLFPDLEVVDTKGWHVADFSADNCNPQSARTAIEEKYWPITEISGKSSARGKSSIEGSIRTAGSGHGCRSGQYEC